MLRYGVTAVLPHSAAVLIGQPIQAVKYIDSPAARGIGELLRRARAIASRSQLTTHALT